MAKKREKTAYDRIPYRFTLYRAQDGEIIEFLDSIPKPLRGKVILQALKLLKEKYEFLTKETQKSNTDSSPVKFKNSFNF